MTPKEKAEELYGKHFVALFIMEKENAKRSALVTVDEILELDNFSIEGRDYWQEVKQEIQNL